MASDTTPQCHFLKLPLELRLQIYALLLLLPPYSRHSIRPVRIHAAVLRASRQIHAEAWPLLYTKNTFLAHPSLLTSFPRLRENYPPVKEQAAVSRIRRFRLLIRLDCDVLFTREEAARALSHMDEVVVDVSQAVFLGAGRENLRVLEGVRGVGRANPGEHDWLRGGPEITGMSIGSLPPGSATT
ncbi:hypothetical protein MAC_00490 [Metarhizium acridum CQMa 102]|uniref:Uncharacterized protein n=1 Tax=Metarhizium acridum (strain CQMa 102) TaxID=655827 RepID=E9DS92_METAQ|nr:uncharacterized protein MAC_00490 [Metarhizium acridum CQMa 102]EFY93252.1 hypothetical protein MAC_00490 [Metarhizium acridum CQMa 102]